ncbi:hypothetical protein [Amycolatopsis thermophila]|uniref:DUF397 domain-containing protein n=1 Tax=Amycolatopsis thermophila TaxID=206084 RepID=A0ABU0EXQ4_9PSEU|nr:hypothetical protein [Amycolatopsis thermophila]MDQ0379552.1 hypothetical protein [Amycolatopsis thermophila]
MDGSRGVRRVRVGMQLRRVRVDRPGGETVALCYPGMLLTCYEDARKVCERWVPLGAEPTEEDDERLIDALHAAMVWRNRLDEDRP